MSVAKFLFAKFSKVWVVFFPLALAHTLYFELGLTCNRLFDSLRRGSNQDTPPGEDLMLHLGAGQHIIPGWVNVDARRNPGIDRVIDLRRRLPFQDESVRYVFSEHVIEHFDYYNEIPGLLKEIHRILKSGGAIRIVVPNAEKCVEFYCRKDRNLFSFLPATINTPMEGLALIFTSFGYHQFAYDFETLCLALKNAGFDDVYETPYLSSSIALLNQEDRNDPRSIASLCVEATKR